MFRMNFGCYNIKKQQITVFLLIYPYTLITEVSERSSKS